MPWSQRPMRSPIASARSCRRDRADAESHPGVRGRGRRREWRRRVTGHWPCRSAAALLPSARTSRGFRPPCPTRYAVNHVSHQPHIPACIALLFVLSCSFATAAAPAAPRDGAHDFDFAFGTWKTRVRRLLHPLSGSSEWTEYEGTSIVRRIWNGRGNTVELDVSGAAGRIEGLSLRLYNPHSRQWSLNYASSASGMLGVPTVGAFENRRGEFYDHESVDGR